MEEPMKIKLVCVYFGKEKEDQVYAPVLFGSPGEQKVWYNLAAEFFKNAGINPWMLKKNGIPKKRIGQFRLFAAEKGVKVSVEWMVHPDEVTVTEVDVPVPEGHRFPQQNGNR